MLSGIEAEMGEVSGSGIEQAHSGKSAEQEMMLGLGNPPNTLNILEHFTPKDRIKFANLALAKAMKMEQFESAGNSDLLEADFKFSLDDYLETYNQFISSLKSFLTENSTPQLSDLIKALNDYLEKLNTTGGNFNENSLPSEKRIGRSLKNDKTEDGFTLPMETDEGRKIQQIQNLNELIADFFDQLTSTSENSANSNEYVYFPKGPKAAMFVKLFLEQVKKLNPLLP